MANEAVMYMRGPFPFYDGLPRVSEEMVLDAKLILSIEKDQLAAIRQGLESNPGFLDRSGLESFLFAQTKNEVLAKKVARFVTAIRERGALDANVSDAIAKQFEEWFAEEGQEQQAKALSQDELSELKSRLPLILAPYPCFERQSKAERLSSATGQPLERLDLICDLRPVFDKEQQNIEGMMPYTVLRVVCTGADGLPIALETILSEKAVDRLVEQATKAKSKLRKLREFLDRKDQKGVAIPVTDLTRQETKDAS